MTELVRPQPSRLYRWTVLLFVSVAMGGNYYIYDSINPLERIFIDKLGFSATAFGWLNSSYSVAVVLTLLIGGIVIDRIGIRHRTNRGPSTRHSRRASARDRLLMLLPGFPQMHVHVDKTGSDDQPARVENLGIFRNSFVPPEPRRYSAVLDEHVLSAVLAVDRVDQMAVFDQEFHYTKSW